MKYWHVSSSICLWKPQITGILGWVVAACDCCCVPDCCVELAADCDWALGCVVPEGDWEDCCCEVTVVEEGGWDTFDCAWLLTAFELAAIWLECA